jgi:hypothetical protein
VGEHYLEKFEIAGTSPSGKGAVVVATTEDHYLVEDKGHDEGVQAEYLVLPVEGQWFIVDRRLGAGQFPSAKVGASYRGYFSGEFEMPKAPSAFGSSPFGAGFGAVLCRAILSRQNTHHRGRLRCGRGL